MNHKKKHGARISDQQAIISSHLGLMVNLHHCQQNIRLKHVAPPLGVLIHQVLHKVKEIFSYDIILGSQFRMDIVYSVDIPVHCYCRYSAISSLALQQPLNHKKLWIIFCINMHYGMLKDFKNSDHGKSPPWTITSQTVHTCGFCTSQFSHLNFRGLFKIF